MTTALLSTLQTKELLGATAVDVSAMVIPRTVIDTKRNGFAGFETFARESVGVVVHSVIGLFGFAAAAALASTINKKYNIDFKQLNADESTIDAFSKAFNESCQNEHIKEKPELLGDFLERVFADVKGLNGNAESVLEAAKEKIEIAQDDVDNFSQIKETAKDDYAKAQQALESATAELDQSITKPKLWHELNDGKIKIIGSLRKAILAENSAFNIPEKLKDELVAHIRMDTGSEKELRATIEGQQIQTEARYLISDAYSLGKSFIQDNVIDCFKTEGLKPNEKTNVLENTFSRELKSLGGKKTVYGLAAISAIGFCVQKINRYFTQKRTGKDGFVGDPDYKNDVNNIHKSTSGASDKTFGFKALKVLVAGAMAGLIIKSIGGKTLNEFKSRIQFRSLLPTANQLKLVYGTTIVGRLLASGDKNELRETGTRDFLGFTNWLILGGVVSRFLAMRQDPSLINYDPGNRYKLKDTSNPLNIWNRFCNWADKLMHSSVKTQEEVMAPTIKKYAANETPIPTIKEIFKRKLFSERLFNQLKTINHTQLMGYVYSCLALGIIVPLFNKYVTEKSKKPSMPQFEDNTNAKSFEKNTPEHKIRQVMPEFMANK